MRIIGKLEANLTHEHKSRLSSELLPSDSVAQQSEAEPSCTQCPKGDKEPNRSRFPLQLVCCRASGELTFYLSVAISALEAECLGNPNVGTRPVPSYSSGGL